MQRYSDFLIYWVDAAAAAAVALDQPSQYSTACDWPSSEPAGSLGCSKRQGHSESKPRACGLHLLSHQAQGNCHTSCCLESFVIHFAHDVSRVSDISYNEAKIL